MIRHNIQTKPTMTLHGFVIIITAIALTALAVIESL